MFGRWRNRKPDDVAQLLGRFRSLNLDDAVIAKLDKHLSEAPDEEGRWLGVAIELRKMGYERACAATYETAQQRFPNSFRLWGNRGVLLRNQGRFDEAVESLRKALAIKPDYMIAIHNLANTYELARDYSSAISWYRQTLAIDGGHAPSWNGLGNCQAEQGQFNEALESYRTAIELDANYSEPQFNWILQLLRRERLQEAVERLIDYLERWPDDTQASQLLATLQEPTHDIPAVHSAQAQTQKKFVVRPIDTTDYEGGATKADTADTVGEKGVVTHGDLSKMSREEAARQGLAGHYDKAQVWTLLNERVARTASAKHPRIFLSYRRESPEHMAWVKRLADVLDERGYEVVLDQNLQTSNSPVSVPQIISEMATCNIFSPVLTDGYFERIEVGDGPVVAHAYLSDGWVFDEFQAALRLGQLKRLVVTGLWRSGTLHSPFTNKNVVDLRQDAAVVAMLDRPFPRRTITVVASRSDSRGRMLGPLGYSKAQAVARELAASGEYLDVKIVNSASG